MSTLLIAVLAGLAFVIAYHTYGRWLGGKIFNLTADAVCPSHRLRDDHDYVPTSRGIVFGHHFTSIAGTGPIVGPAIAVMWGWLPALLWVVFGSIFIGAVHDLGSLVVSLRNNGQTVGDVAGRVLNRRVRLLFLLVLFMALTIVLAIFGLVIAAVFKQYPASIVPCLVQIPIAAAIGVWLHRKGVHLLLPSIVALGVMYATVIFGDAGVLHVINTWLASQSMMWWVIVLLGYSYVASVLPVWSLLQPRDYINSLQLISALGLIVVGLVVAAFVGGAPAVEGGPMRELKIVAPMIDFNPAQAPLIFPFLFITIACGAISGFHCLVSSGTSSKQLSNECDAKFVGFGSMLVEGFLATLVILACVAGLGLGSKGADGVMVFGQAAWEQRYSSWATANGLGAKVGAFVDGAANFLTALHVPMGVAIALMGVLVASFAGTTLDTACRLQRYVVQEIASTANLGRVPGLKFLRNKHGATLFAVVIAVLMASMPIQGAAWSWANAGKGGMILWPMFGATNQLLGGLAFLVIAFWLWRRKKPVWFLVFPLLFMLVMPAWALVTQLFVGDGSGQAWVRSESPNWALIGIAVATLVLEMWMIVEAVLLLPRVRGVLEESLNPEVPAVETTS